MKNIAEQLALYQSYHRSAGCKATHFFGVPLVTFAILIPMGWFSAEIAGIRVSLAMVFIVATLIHYFWLDKILAAMMLVIMIPLGGGADWVSRLTFRDSLMVFAATFILGWALQLVGHSIEGKRPALLDNFFQSVFTAPLFLLVEAVPGQSKRIFSNQ